MTHDPLTLLAFGIGLAAVVLSELSMRKRRRRPGWGMDRLTDLDGREWYYYRRVRSAGDFGGAGDSGAIDVGAGNDCHGGDGSDCGGH
jgi:hypothetical protein